MLALLRSQLGTNSKKEMEEMLKQGYSMQQILEHFMKNGKTEEEEQREGGGSEFAKKFKVVHWTFSKAGGISFRIHFSDKLFSHDVKYFSHAICCNYESLTLIHKNHVLQLK